MEAFLVDAHAEVPLVTLLLQDPVRMDAELADATRSASVLPRLVGVSLVATAAHALTLGVILQQSGPEDLARETLRIGAAYTFGFFGAQIAALPSAWFYALLAGIRQPAWRVAGEAMRAHATSSMVLIGLLPVYFAAGLGAAVVDPTRHGFAMLAVVFGFVLPFLSGLAGTVAMFRAFRRQLATVRLDPEASRSPAPSLLVLAWAFLFTTMAPVGVAYMMGGW